jgi:hypothetical protein
MIITDESVANGGQPGVPVETNEVKAPWSKAAISCGGFGPVYPST